MSPRLLAAHTCNRGGLCMRSRCLAACLPWAELLWELSAGLGESPGAVGRFRQALRHCSLVVEVSAFLPRATVRTNSFGNPQEGGTSVVTAVHLQRWRPGDVDAGCAESSRAVGSGAGRPESSGWHEGWWRSPGRAAGDRDAPAQLGVEGDTGLRRRDPEAGACCGSSSGSSCLRTGKLHLASPLPRPPNKALAFLSLPPWHLLLPALTLRFWVSVSSKSCLSAGEAGFHSSSFIFAVESLWALPQKWPSFCDSFVCCMQLIKISGWKALLNETSYINMLLSLPKTILKPCLSLSCFSWFGSFRKRHNNNNE